MTQPAGAVTKDEARHYPIQGRLMPSASTVTKVLDKPGLTTWKLKRVALAIATDAKLAAKAAKGYEYGAAMDALDNGGQPSYESQLGTDVHYVIECWHQDEEPDWDEVKTDRAIVTEHLHRYQEAAAHWGIEPVYVEQTIFHDKLEYAGTMDAAVMIREKLPCMTVDNPCQKAHVLDVKTGKSVWPDVALQLAGYAHATHTWNAEADTVAEVDPLCWEYGLAASVHADECLIYPVRIVDAFGAFAACRDIFRWDGIKKGELGEPFRMPAGGAAW